MLYNMACVSDESIVSANETVELGNINPALVLETGNNVNEQDLVSNHVGRDTEKKEIQFYSIFYSIMTSFWLINDFFQGPRSLSIRYAPAYFFTIYTKNYAHAFSLDVQMEIFFSLFICKMKNVLDRALSASVQWVKSVGAYFNA